MNTITKEAYEGDIVSRLRNWRGLHLAHGGELFEEAADEIEALRSSGWIAVSEGVPDKEIDVLAYWPPSDSFAAPWLNVARVAEDGGWEDSTEALKAPSYWMPLPEPPQ